MKKNLSTLRNLTPCLFLVGILSSLHVTGVEAAVIYDSNGFESPTFSVGTISGQNGWTAPVGNASSLLIENSVAYAGTQALYLQNSGARDLARKTLSSAQTADFWSDVYILPPSISDIQSNFSLNFRDSTGTIRAYVSFTALGVLTSSGGTVANSTYNQGAWNRLSVFFDFDGGGNKYYIYLNGTLKTPTGFTFAGSNLQTFDFDWTSTSSAPTTGGGYVDNFVLQTTSPIPEPANLALVGCAGLILGLKTLRRKRNLFY